MDKKKKKDEKIEQPECESLENEAASNEAVNTAPAEAVADDQAEKLAAVQKELDETRDR